MSATLETIESQALTLTETQRLVLVHRLLASIEGVTEEGADAAWDMEIKERIRKYDAGITKGIPSEKVFKDLDKKLGK